MLDLGHAIVIRPMPTGDPFLASRGILKGKVSTQALLKMRREERAREEKAFR